MDSFLFQLVWLLGWLTGAVGGWGLRGLLVRKAERLRQHAGAIRLSAEKLEGLAAEACMAKDALALRAALEEPPEDLGEQLAVIGELLQPSPLDRARSLGHTLIGMGGVDEDVSDAYAKHEAARAAALSAVEKAEAAAAEIDAEANALLHRPTMRDAVRSLVSALRRKEVPRG